MKKNIRILLLASLLVLFPLACGSVTPSDTPTPGLEPGPGDQESLVAAARQDLAQRLGIDAGEVTVDQVTATQFRDSCLEVQPPGVMCAQVITPGYIIMLSAGGQSYRYHAAGDRIVLAEGQEALPQGSLTVEQVEVAAGGTVTVRGASTLPDGSCLNSELSASGTAQDWWPGDECVFVQDGAWKTVVYLGEEGAPDELDPEALYVLRVFLRARADIADVFAFDLAGPPGEAP